MEYEKILHEYLAKPDKTLYQHTKEVVECLIRLNELGYVRNGYIYELAKKACYYHDFGKMNESFQERVSHSTKKIMFDEKKEVPHNVLSMAFLDRATFEDERSYLIALFAVGFHHNYGDVFELWEMKSELREELLLPFQVYVNRIKKSSRTKLLQLIEDVDAIIVKGLVQKCDHSASAGAIVEYPNDFLQEKLDRLQHQWVMNQSSTGWNELQLYCKEHSEENIIAIAETGMGKTEAVLLWTGEAKAFYVLPVRTAINSMYLRLRDVLLQNESVKERLGLLHSESLEFCIQQNEDSEDMLEHYELTRRLSMPLTITTMDQIFDFVYKYPGYELKLATFSYSRIIIDEIQMYGPDVLAYMILGLERIHEMGGKIAIVTATLFPFVQELLIKRIPFTTEQFVKKQPPRHHVKVKDEFLQISDICALYQKNRDDCKPNKILVICNTVRKAQEIYRQLKEEMVDSRKEINLLHSRYTRKDRANKEEEIVVSGRTYDEKGEVDVQNTIWVTTSLVEASLDIDFDYLFTELQDLASLFQRLGRCNRKGKKPVDKPNCYVYIKIDPKLLDEVHGFIDATIYKLSKQAIFNDEYKMDGVISEEEKRSLINKYFTMEQLKESRFMEKYREIYNSIHDIRVHTVEKCEIDLRNIRSVTIIPGPVYKNNKEVIRNVVSKLGTSGADYLEIQRLKNEIKQFTVSIPEYVFHKYKKSLTSGNAEAYPPVLISKYTTIPVIECEYDDVGFQEINFHERKLEALIW